MELLILGKNIYRPQTKFAKLMFSQVFVWPWGGGFSVQGGLCPRGLSVRVVSVGETPRMANSGRYASYWNAFLFKINSGKQK